MIPGKASRSCCALQAAVGCAVTARCTMRRRSCATMTRTNKEPIRGGRDDEEIGRHDLGDMIREKRAPGLRGRAPTPHHVLRDGRS